MNLVIKSVIRLIKDFNESKALIADIVESYKKISRKLYINPDNIVNLRADEDAIVVSIAEEDEYGHMVISKERIPFDVILSCMTGGKQ